MLAAMLALGAVSLASGEARAAEDAKNIYLLGTKGSMAGFVPPPGIYFIDVNYFYAGDASGLAAGGRTLRRLGDRFLNLPPRTLTLQVDVKLDGDAEITAPSVLWVAPGKVLGGNVGFGAIGIWGRSAVDVDVDVLATLTLPLIDRTIQRGRHDFDDSTTDLGDPFFNALIGWHEGNWHWNIGTLINVPIGPWSKTSVTNLSFNHWGLDATGAATWLDPTIGLELSSAVGFTFNWENPDTDYETGTEFHVEWAVVQHFSKKLGIGIVGYHYKQITADSGVGATLGAFKGRVTALGPTLSYSFQLGKLPVSTQWSYFHEFDVENRVEGDAGLLTISMPLSVAGH